MGIQRLHDSMRLRADFAARFAVRAIAANIVGSFGEVSKAIKKEKNRKEEEAKENEREVKEEQAEEDEKEEPELEEIEEPQMEVEDEEPPKVELTADEKEVIAAKAELDKEEASLVVAQAAFDAIRPSQQSTSQIHIKANTKEATKAKAGAQKAMNAAKKEVNEARERRYKALIVMEKQLEKLYEEAKIAGRADR